MYSRIYTEIVNPDCRPSIPLYSGTGTVLFGRGQLGSILSKEASATCLLPSCYILFIYEYDSGSQTSSVSSSFAKQQGIHGRMCDVIVDDGLSQTGTRVTEVHELPI